MQGFKFIYNEYGAPATRITNILFTDSEAGTKGEAVMLSSGRFTKLTGNNACAGFLNADVTSGTDQTCEVIQAREGDVFEAPYTGTPDAGFIVGATAADIASDGLSVNSADVTSGAFSIIEKNTADTTCRLKVKNRQLS